MVRYRATTLIPPLVRRAKNLANQMQYRFNCSNGTGRLLRLLASQFQSGIVGEIGSACGVGGSWIVSALQPGSTFVTIDNNASLAAVVRTLFEDFPSVRVLNGEWHDLVRYGPFNLVYVSASRALQCAPEVLLQALRIGGAIVIDSLVPIDQLSIELRDHTDPLRSFWLNDTRLLATEIFVSTGEAVILASRME